MAVRKRKANNGGMIRKVVDRSDLPRLEQIALEISDFLRWEERARNHYESEKDKAIVEIGPRLEEARKLHQQDREYGRWLKANWGWSQQHAWNFVEASKTLKAIDAVTTKNKIGCDRKPDGERQLRILNKVSSDPIKRAEAWVEIAPSVETNKQGKPKSSAAIAKQLQERGYIEKQKPNSAPKPQTASANQEKKPNAIASLMELVKDRGLSKAELISLSESIRQYADSI